MGEQKELKGIARILFKDQKTIGSPEAKAEAALKELKGAKKLAFILKRLGETESEKEKIFLRKALQEGAFDEGALETLNLSYDSPTEGLEPAYFWILDFAKHTLRFEMTKTKEDFEASVGSAFFSDIGAKATRMQEQAMKMMGSINTVIRSIINLLYDLKEFDIRLQTYAQFRNKNPQEHMEGLLSLKQVWMDQVDVKKGVGSINGLAQQLQFVTLRDAFLHVEKSEDVTKKDLDLNERVKRILIVKLSEFYKWVDSSEAELTKRYQIEQKYLKSQVASLKMYAEWTKPYLIAAKKLGMKDFNSPNIVGAFNNLEMELELMGQKETKVQSLIEDEKLPEDATTTDKIYQVIRVKFKFRSIPQGSNTQQGYAYRQGGRFDMVFYSYALTAKQLAALKKAEEDEGLDLINDMVETSLRELGQDILKYLEEGMLYKNAFEKEQKQNEIAEKNYAVGPFKALFGGFGDIFKPLSKSFSFRKSSDYYNQFVISEAKDGATGSAFTLYDVYKKAHGMLSV